MSISLLTNLNSLSALENLRGNDEFQGRTIRRLSSGFRINSAADDPAGLALANSYRQDTAERNQGVSNVHDGISTLQIIDGGMSNISQILDRLKTLATQSASATFTGDRNTLNAEFQTLLGEIDRQAQSIGLDPNGQFAQSLSIYVGGSSSGASVTVDLSSSSVDSRSLGLGVPGAIGMQVMGAAGFYVVQSLADPLNTTAAPGYIDFYMAGPGFSDNSKIKVSVNRQGVHDLNSLVASINTAIQAAASGTSRAAAAFAGSGIAASVYTGANGNQQLSFGSRTTAFQVEAGDRMANALMGHLVVVNGVVSSTGTPLATTVSGVAPAPVLTSAPVTVRFTGAGLPVPVDITLDPFSTTTDLQNKVSSNQQLADAGISAAIANDGSLTFTGARGEKFSVAATGDTGNALGLGTFVDNGTGAVDYTSVQGSYYLYGAYGQASLEFSINGATSVAVPPIQLSGGNATAGTLYILPGNINVAQGDDLQLTVDGIAQPPIVFASASTTATGARDQINTAAGLAGVNVTASVDPWGRLLVASNTTGAHSSIGVTGGAAVANLGLTLNTTYIGHSQPGSDIAAQLNADFQADPILKAAGLSANFSAGAGTLTISSGNNTFFRINPGGSDPHADLGFGTAGQPFTSTLTATPALDQPVDSGGASSISPLAFSALAYGSDDQLFTISAKDASGTLQSLSITLRNDDLGRQGRSIDEAIAYINAQLQSIPAMQKIVAVKEDVGGAERINFLSSLPSFSIKVGASPNGNGLNGGAVISEDSSPAGGSRNLAIDNLEGAIEAVTAVAAAVGALGTAQAVVGKGQNQLGYALNLAQSQITNFSAVDSGIRDADVAAEAANFTKSQVIQQATLAALAQANTSAEAVLALLKG